MDSRIDPSISTPAVLHDTLTTDAEVLQDLQIDAIIEVAALFIGIFVCMQPALQILSASGSYLVERFQMGPEKFFWATGFLSAFLDNAPTYLVFFKTAQDPATIAGSVTGGVNEMILAGISLGAVFMGAMTYIGNGPNFMVKAIAEKSGVRMPSSSWRSASQKRLQSQRMM